MSIENEALLNVILNAELSQRVKTVKKDVEKFSQKQLLRSLNLFKNTYQGTFQGNYTIDEYQSHMRKLQMQRKTIQEKPKRRGRTCQNR